jgi:hypothetical protein
VKARRWFSLPGLLRRPAFTLLVKTVSNEREYCFQSPDASVHSTLAGILPFQG